MTYSIVTPPLHGTLSGTLPNLTYTPNAAFVGTDTFTFRVSDGSLFSSNATGTINVTLANVAPVAQPQGIVINRGQSVNFTLVGTDANGDLLTYSINISGVAQGSITGTPPNLTYIANSLPPNGATDSFTFTVNDGSPTSAPATVDVTILP